MRIRPYSTSSAVSESIFHVMLGFSESSYYRVCNRNEKSVSLLTIRLLSYVTSFETNFRHAATESMKPNKALLFLFVVMIAGLAAACGSGSNSGSPSLAKINPSETIFTLDDLLAIGFKKGKTFDVEGLTGATDAYWGFWGVDPYDRKEFEARFYPTHSDAVEFGVSFADERTGTDAVIKSGETMWEEGAKEARACTRSAGGDSSNCRISKYGDYVIYGNLVLICQGRDSATALEQCGLLLSEFIPELAEQLAG